MLLVARIRQRCRRGSLQIGQSVAGQLVQAGQTLRPHFGFQNVEVLQESRITSRLEQVGGCRDGQCAGGQEGNGVERVRAARIRDVQVAIKLLDQLVEQVNGQGIEGAS